VTANTERHIDIHRQSYNHTRYEYNALDTDEVNIGSAYQHQKRLPEWKQRGRSSQKSTRKLAENSRTLLQQPLHPQRQEREGVQGRRTPVEVTARVPERDVLTIRIQTQTHEWPTLEDTALPEKPPVDELDAEDCVAIDLGITNCIYTSDGDSVDLLALTDEYERLRREQRSLSRKDHGSNNWETQRRKVATVKRRIKRKVEDFHKLSTWLVKTYDAVFFEDLNVSGTLQRNGNARARQDVVW
jgi:putative transposase